MVLSLLGATTYVNGACIGLRVLLLVTCVRLPCEQGAVAGEARLQVCFFSATLHSPEITALSARICQHPTWVDLKVVMAQHCVTL